MQDEDGKATEHERESRNGWLLAGMRDLESYDCPCMYVSAGETALLLRGCTFKPDIDQKSAEMISQRLARLKITGTLCPMAFFFLGGCCVLSHLFFDRLNLTSGTHTHILVIYIYIYIIGVYIYIYYISYIYIYQ